MAILPGMKRLLIVATAGLLLGACQSSSQKENTDLKAKVAELQAKADKLEADNERLKQQVSDLIESTDKLAQVLKAQNALGTLPAATASPTATPR